MEPTILYIIICLAIGGGGWVYLAANTRKQVEAN